MSTSPQFATTVNIGSNAVSASQDSSYTSPSHAVTIVSAGSNGTKIEEVVFTGIGTTVAGLVVLYLLDNSSNYHYFDSVVVTVVTPSTTASPFRVVNSYANLFLKSGWSLVATSFSNNQLINVTAFGGDY